MDDRVSPESELPTVETAGEPGYWHAVAVDYDGTLAEGDRPSCDALATLDDARVAGRRVVLVTGRILSELRNVFSDADTHFDLIIGENGAVVSRDGTDRNVAAPIPGELATALETRGITFERGRVLLACEGADESTVLAEVRRLGLECQLVRNRGSLMVLPPGVSKGSGLFEGLGDLGISHHNTIAIGDAENDHSLLEACELGVAVANAVDALKAHADIILDDADGQGVAAFLRGPVIAGHQRVHPKRWEIELGSLADGTPVAIPASQLNVLVTGSPRRGKSYVAGLIAERLIGLGYSVLIIDPEGDHTSLGRLRGVLVVGGANRLPAPEELVQLVRHRFASVVVDLSGMPAIDRAAYLRDAPAAIETQRARIGLPHWVIIDEAQEPLGRDGVRDFLDPGATGYCLVTYRPEDLRAEALLSIDVLIALPGRRDLDHTVDLVAAAGAISHAQAHALVRSADRGQAVLVDRIRGGGGIVFSVAQRGTGHMRHWHKYAAGSLPRERAFHFRRDWNTATGATAGSIDELERELHVCEDHVIGHHSSHEDFSRWIADVLGDPPLAAAVAAIESAVNAGTVDAADGRVALIRAIHDRYPG